MYQYEMNFRKIACQYLHIMSELWGKMKKGQAKYLNSRKTELQIWHILLVERSWRKTTYLNSTGHKALQAMHYIQQTHSTKLKVNPVLLYVSSAFFTKLHVMFLIQYPVKCFIIADTKVLCGSKIPFLLFLWWKV